MTEGAQCATPEQEPALEAGPETVRYKASKTLARFMRSDARIRGVRGPIGSGKTTACLWEMMRRIHAQAPDRDGVRRSRWLVVRNSYRELADTTRASLWQWFPQSSLGNFRVQDNVQEIRAPGLEAELLFRSLDSPEDIRKLLSLEITAAYVNEAREIPLSVIHMIEGRIGRYPRKIEGAGGASFAGIIMDTNPPAVGHWWEEMFEHERPKGWAQFVQPSGIGPDAENLVNLPRDYYQNMMPGKSAEWKKVYCEGHYGFLSDGMPVYPDYIPGVHFDPLLAWDGSPVWLGLDFGLTPAAIFLQRKASGRIEAVRELCTTNTGAARFAEEVRRILNADFGGRFAGAFGDPAGDIRSGTDEQTVFQVLAAKGLPATPAHTQDPVLRRESVAGLLRRLDMEGKPALLVGGACPTLAKGMAGFYRYRRLQVPGLEVRHDAKPEKNRYSHPCEALEYGLLGMGEASEVIKMPARASVRRHARGVI